MPTTIPQSHLMRLHPKLKSLRKTYLEMSVTNILQEFIKFNMRPGHRTPFSDIVSEHITSLKTAVLRCWFVFGLLWNNSRTNNLVAARKLHTGAASSKD